MNFSSQPSGRVVIAGGSGFLGISLARFLAVQGWSIVILSRHQPKVSGPWEHQAWDARSVADWKQTLEGAAGVVNLVGRSVDCIKTPDHQDEILRSRLEATRVLGQAMRQLASPPPVWVQMSTAHIYGDPPEVVCNEDSAFGYGLAPFVGKAWEAEFQAAVLPQQRPVILRTSFVLGRDQGAGCGAMSKLASLTRWGLGGRIGSGKQGLSWIHEADLNALFERALTDDDIQGAYIASAANPVSQAEFMRELRRALRVPVGLPASAAMVQLGARWLLKTDPELALYGRYVVSRRLQEAGFSFRFPQLPAALHNLYR